MKRNEILKKLQLSEQQFHKLVRERYISKKFDENGKVVYEIIKELPKKNTPPKVKGYTSQVELKKKGIKLRNKFWRNKRKKIGKYVYYIN